MLTVLALAEGFRLTEFFKIQTGSYEAGAASAAVSVIVVLYLALFHMKKASVFATAICIFLSLASFLRPYEDLQVSTVKRVNSDAEKTLPIPQYDPRKCRGTDEAKESCLKSYDKEVARIEKHNARIEKLLTVGESKTLRLSEIVVFVLGAVVLGFCVPVLTFVVSHKLADDFSKFRKGAYNYSFTTSQSQKDILDEISNVIKDSKDLGILKESEKSDVETPEIFEVPKDVPASVEKQQIKFETRKHPPRQTGPIPYLR
jgi:hypothetical protein